MRRLVVIGALVAAAVASGVTYAAFSSTSSVGSSSFSSSGVFCTNARTDTYSTSIADTQAQQDKPASSGGGTATTMTVTADSNGAKSKRVLVAFGSGSAPWTYTSSLGHNCSVTSATLTLYASTGVTGRTIAAYNATGSWNESTQYQYGASPAPGQSGTAATAGSVASGSTISFNVTSLVQSQYTGSPGANYGFWIEDANEGSGSTTTQIFATREDSTSSHRPTLSITYGG